MADDTKKPVTFSKASAKRIAAVVKRVEHSYRNGPPVRGRYPVGDSQGGRVAKVKTTVSARSGATYGAGTVTFQVDGGSAYADGADDVPVKNPYAAELAVGTWVTVVPAAGGWTIFGADCPE